MQVYAHSRCPIRSVRVYAQERDQNWQASRPLLCLFFFFFPSTTFTVLLLSNSYHIHSPLLLGKVSEKKKKKKSQDSRKPRMNEWGLTGKLSIATLIEVSCDANYSVAIDIR